MSVDRLYVHSRKHIFLPVYIYYEYFNHSVNYELVKMIRPLVLTDCMPMPAGLTIDCRFLLIQRPDPKLPECQLQ